MKAHHLILILLQILPHFPSVLAVKYEAVDYETNTPGGARFEAKMGIPYTKQIMQRINSFIWDTFKQHKESDRKQVETVRVLIKQYDGAEAIRPITYGETINVSSLYLQGYKGNLKWEYTSLLYHEMTHMFQWDGEGKAPISLVEGVPDYMILNQGYDITARFLEYCEGLKLGFVAELNKKMRHGFSEDYFVELLGKTVGQLWAEYKAKYTRSSLGA